MEDLPVDAKKKLKTLSSLEFISIGQNVILAGNPGTGKAHISIGLGIKACLAGYKVLFITVSSLITQLKESRSNKVLRAGRKSTIVTTNLSFERWGEIFKDPIMTAAMIDRLTHKAYIVNMNGNSYKLKETREWLEKQK